MRGAVWRTAAVIAGFAVCVVATSCSASTPAASSSPSSSASTVTPQRAITLAADETEQVRTLSGTMSIRVGPSVSFSGPMRMQVKPSLLLGGNLNASVNGLPAAISVIITSTALYIELPGGTGQPGKPWMEILFSSLSGNLGTALNQALQATQNSNPLTQTRLLATSANVHKVGTAVVGGVSTTEYSGIISPAAAVSALPPSLSTQLAPELKMITGDISWSAWLDRQHMVRKLTEHETIDGQAAALAFTITSVNQPVTVTVPPASQVTVTPASVLYATEG
jgi:hypothetical protein